MVLYTIGYQGLQPDEFVSILKQHNIGKIIDVRETPHSRKQGFSLKHLTAFADVNGMEYISLRNLGSPASLRQKLRQDGNHQKFIEMYRKHLAIQKEDLNNLINMVRQGDCCLLCYENDVNFCHRKIIAEEVAEMDHGVEVFHL